jgi:hypothetical protein
VIEEAFDDEENEEAATDDAPLFTGAELARFLNNEQVQSARPPDRAETLPTTAPGDLEDYRRLEREYNIQVEELLAKIKALPDSRPAMKSKLEDELMALQREKAALVNQFKYDQLRQAMSRPVPLSPEAQALKDKAIADGTYQPYVDPRVNPWGANNDGLRKAEDAEEVRDFLGGTS